MVILGAENDGVLGVSSFFHETILSFGGPGPVGNSPLSQRENIKEQDKYQRETNQKPTSQTSFGM